MLHGLAVFLLSMTGYWEEKGEQEKIKKVQEKTIRRTINSSFFRCLYIIIKLTVIKEEKE